MSRPDYPLRESQPERIRSRTGLPLENLTLEDIRTSRVGPEDCGIAKETLCRQADISQRAGYPQLAENLRRAAEMVNVPNEKLLAVYEALRPRRCSYDELMAIAEELLAKYQAPLTATLVGEAAEACRSQGLLKDGTESERSSCPTDRSSSC